jgi:hypothetical protein
VSSREGVLTYPPDHQASSETKFITFLTKHGVEKKQKIISCDKKLKHAKKLISTSVKRKNSLERY